MRGSLRGRVSEVCRGFRAFERFSEVFRDFQRFFKGQSCCPLKLPQTILVPNIRYFRRRGGLCVLFFGGGGEDFRVKTNFWVRTPSSGVGFFRVKGWGSKNSVCPSKPAENKLFGGVSQNFAGISRGCPNSLSAQNLCSSFGP